MRRATKEIVAEIRRRVGELKLLNAETPAFERVELFDSDQLPEAFTALLISEQRVCVVVPLDERFETVMDQRKLTVKRVLPVAILISDRVMGDRKAALWGDASTAGADALKELVLTAVTGLLLPNPGGVLCEPVNVTVMTVRDTEKDMPGRVAVALEVNCRGGIIEAQLGNKGVVF